MPKFQRRHYEAVAELLKTEFEKHELGYKAAIVQMFCKLFKEDNLKFKETKFWIAFGLPAYEAKKTSIWDPCR